MTLTVREDLVEGSTSLALTGGYTASRVFFIDGVEGNPDSIGFQAIESGLVPKPGEPHPAIPLLIVDTVSYKPEGSKQGKLTINYKALTGGSTQPDEEAQTQISVSASVQTVLTNKQIKGGKEELIIVKYKYPIGKNPRGPDVTEEIIATINKQEALVVITFSRVETTDPKSKAIKNVGKLNSKAFLGEKKHVWQCTKLGGPSNDGGQTYQVVYEFTRAEGGWNTDVAYADENTGKIPTDIEDQPDALINVITQREADFNALNLGPLSTS